MGYDLGFIAFDREPAVRGLAGLTRYRLFKRANRFEWYLDGPNKGPNVIPLFERPSIDERKLGEAWLGAKHEYTSLVSETKRLGYGPHGLDYKLIPIALALSSALDCRLLVGSGNDEDLDCAFICSNGQLLSGRFVVDEERGVVFHREKGSEVVQLDWSDGHYLYGLIGAVACEYFGEGDALSYADEWQEIGENNYVLEDQRN
jgi:hypothetical protein